jgi:hypothetical protein
MLLIKDSENCRDVAKDEFICKKRLSLYLINNAKRIENQKNLGYKHAQNQIAIFYSTTQRSILEVLNLQQNRCESPTSLTLQPFGK